MLVVAHACPLLVQECLLRSLLTIHPAQAHYSAAAKGIVHSAGALDAHWARAGPAVRATAEAELATRAGVNHPQAAHKRLGCCMLCYSVHARRHLEHADLLHALIVRMQDASACSDCAHAGRQPKHARDVGAPACLGEGSI
jgi:hypothetical protein